MGDPFVGDIIIFAGNFCPRGWAQANGQLMAISQNNALFSLFGTIYGGDGRTTFALPDLRGRMIVGDGQGTGLTNRRIGTKAGNNHFVVTANNLGGHTHAATTTSLLSASSTTGTSSTPTDSVLSDDGGTNIYNNTTTNVTMNSASISSSTTINSTGVDTSSKDVQQPSTALKYCVALVGVYPSRN